MPVPPRIAYAAFLDPEALAAWLPPGDMTGRVHSFDGRIGGGYTMSLYYAPNTDHPLGKFAVDEDRVVVRFDELEPPHRILETVRFPGAEPAFDGSMTLEVSFVPTEAGTEVTLTFRNLPAGLDPRDNDAGARESLEQLAAWLDDSTRTDL